MIRALVLALAVLTQQSVPDMSKMGPWTRKPTNEDKIKKDVTAFLKQEDMMMQTQDQQGMLRRIDFPVFMVTDDQQGAVEAKAYTREQYVAIMKPMWDNPPKQIQITHNHDITVLSDSLVSLVDDFTLDMGQGKKKGKSSTFLIKKDGEWKWKFLAEAGWGGMSHAAGAK
jgi:hypothetical protein